MCLAIPAKVISIDSTNETAIVALGELKKQVSIALLDSLSVDDYVLVHVGYALQKIDPQQAQQTLDLFAQAKLDEILSEHKDA